MVSLVYLLYGYAALLRIALSQGELETAHSALQQFEHLGMDMNQPLYRLTRSYLTASDQVRLWLADREVDRATRWAKQLEMGMASLNPFVREREAVACARVFLARQQPALALQRLEPALQRATQGQRWGQVLEIRLLQALAHQKQHEEPQALATLSEALRLGEPEGYLRSFVEEGAPMIDLLSKLRERQRQTGPTPYLDTLLATFAQQGKTRGRSSKTRRKKK